MHHNRPINLDAECRLSKEMLELALLRAGLIVSKITYGTLLNQPNDKSLTKLHSDSRKVAPGDIFLAYQGVDNDGHLYIFDAIDRGATVIIHDQPISALKISALSQQVLAIRVRDSREAWSLLAAASFDNPQDHLTFFGITGTNGKTSTTWMASAIIRACGIPCLSIGTLGAFFGSEYISTNHTTPDPNVLFALLKMAVNRGIRYVIMEVSSHSIVQHKISPIRFAGAAFTSFSRDHLDFHKTIDDYFSAKWMLFTKHCLKNAVMLFNDSLTFPPSPNTYADTLGSNTCLYGFSPPNLQQKATCNINLRIEAINDSISGSTIKILLRDQGDFDGLPASTKPSSLNKILKIPYFSDHAQQNFAAAYFMAAQIVGYFPNYQEVANLPPIPGRLQMLQGSKSSPTVIVDYAHTPDALEKTLKVLQHLSDTPLTVVFGCGGNRDRGKRPLMGKIAAQLAGNVYITSDNPRLEDPDLIISEIIEGIPNSLRFKVKTWSDRRLAIEQAIVNTPPLGIVLIAGKGHESYQIIGTSKLPFDDGMVAKEFLDLM